MNGAWLLRSDVARDLHARMRLVAPTAEQRKQAAAAHAAARGGGPRNLRIAGDTAEIGVEGVLTPQRDFLLWLLGIQNTSYESIMQALAAAEADPSVKRIAMQIDSPGGTVAGLFETLATIERTKKPISVRAAMACSAAYAIAATAGTITAVTPASQFGSVGVVASIAVDDDSVDITSTDAPKKRPDVTTPEGQAMVREELDALHELFVQTIAKGRGTTAARVNADFGRGGVLLAGKAKTLGMIDGIQTNTAAGARAASSTVPKVGAIATETRKMDIETLKMQHPALFAQVVQIGRDEEHDRVTSHLTFAASSGDMKGALEDIKAKTPMSQTVMARHMGQALNRRDQLLRQSESDDVSDVFGNAARPAPGERAADDGDRVAAAMGLTRKSA